ncbi:MAG: GAF domain-containing protein, partial [Chitinophagaceae bacterium]|nr:GAF domain-containing protein [Chitinophagaceae bacterium]
MMNQRSYPVPTNEQKRLRALRQYQLLDTVTEEEYDRITKIAAGICNVPVSMMTLLDDERQWFKSTFGFAIRETPRELAFCNYTILDAEKVLMVEDLRSDVRFSNNPLVQQDPHVVFYAGAPLVTPQGYV